MSASAGVTLSERVISALGKVITGDPVRKGSKPVAPYRSGPEIIRFFNDFGFNDIYSGSDSRWSMAESRIRQLNGDKRLIKVIEESLAPSHYTGSLFTAEGATGYLEPYLTDDGHGLVLHAGRYRVQASAPRSVSMERSFVGSQEINHAFINEQCEKCDRKVTEGDFSGAITNARSLVEAVLQEMERRLTPGPHSYDGDLQKLYKRVRGLLNIDPKGGETQPFHMVLVGLSNVVDGLAPMRNSMSDAHPLSYKPARHHAKLAVNAAKTIADFIFDTFEFQVAAGKLKPIKGSP